MPRLYLSDYSNLLSSWIDALEERKEALQKGIDRTHDYIELVGFLLKIPIDNEEVEKIPEGPKRSLYVLERALAAAENDLAPLQTFETALDICSVERSRVLWLIEEYFSLEEVKTLAFELDLDYDNLPGQEKTSKARELIIFAERCDKLKMLIANARRRRLNADWEICLYRELFISSDDV